MGNQSPSLGKINIAFLSLFEVVQRVRRLLDDGDADLVAHGDDVAVAHLFSKKNIQKIFFLILHETFVPGHRAPGPPRMRNTSFPSRGRAEGGRPPAARESRRVFEIKIKIKNAQYCGKHLHRTSNSASLGSGPGPPATGGGSATCSRPENGRRNGISHKIFYSKFNKKGYLAGRPREPRIQDEDAPPGVAPPDGAEQGRVVREAEAAAEPVNAVLGAGGGGGAAAAAAAAADAASVVVTVVVVAVVAVVAVVVVAGKTNSSSFKLLYSNYTG